MPTPTKGRRLGGSSAHQRHILANLATALFEHGKITTTEARARRLRPYAEKLITFAKRGDMHARRQVLTVVPDKGIVHNLFTEIGPSFADRPGGYTRITKLGPRKGDAAPMAVIELVREEVAGARPRRRTRQRRARVARRGQGGTDCGRRRPDRRRRARRPVPDRRLSDRLGHLVEHERKRGDRGARGRGRPRERRRKHGPVLERRLSVGGAPGGARRRRQRRLRTGDEHLLAVGLGVGGIGVGARSGRRAALL